MSKTIKHLFVAVCLFAGSAFATCTDPGTPHAITGNLSVELYGPVDTRHMYVTNQCECYGESMIFPASKVTVVNILDDQAYKDMGWTTRCRNHGGLSTGPRTPEGLERCRKANWKHGRYARPT